MKSNTLRFSRIRSLFKNRINLFYFLAFIPLLFTLYFNAWVLIIAFYGFVFLLLKSQQLQSAKEAKSIQRILGFMVIISSFLVYYALVLIVPTAAFYGAANYIVFLLGLFLFFFDFSALKEAFTPLFFITAASGSSIVADWLEPFLSPYLGDIANLIVNILRTIGVNARISYNSSIPLISLTSLSGNFVIAAFAYGCIGIFSTLIFSIILVIVLFEDPSSWKTRLSFSFVGVLGTFALNIVRVTIIFITDFFYGAEAGATVHYLIGYALFSAWLAIFLYLYYKRQALLMKTESIWKRRDSPKDAVTSCS